MLELEYKRIITFLNNQKIDYFVIGGIAVSVMGNPRETIDIDLCIFIKKKEVENFLDRCSQSGFSVNKEQMLKQIKSTGCFNIMAGNVRIDFLIASHEFEKSAFSRKVLIEMHKVKAYYPTPEDLILLKIIPARHIDMADIENIARRYSGKLDKEYLVRWAQRLSDEAEDMRIYNQIEKLLYEL